MGPARNYLIVGAGFSGATLARELADRGHHVDIMDKRDHVAGNAHDEVNVETGIRYHRYGPHLFHTNNEEVFNHLSRFTEWLPYEHRVSALLSGHLEEYLVPFPPNKMTRSIMSEPSDEVLLDTFFRPYTRKMWGMELEELDPGIINRVPVRHDHEDRYFPNDRFQFMPKDGYTSLVLKMLDHPNIMVATGMSFDKSQESEYDHVFNSMAIDEYHSYEHGELPYRSIKFNLQVIPVPKLYDAATVNFTHAGPHTRVTEWKKIPGHGDHPTSTLVTFEEPCDYRDNGMERYYPVKDLKGLNRSTYEKYKSIKTENTTFIGRTGQYVYMDMHMAINASLQLAKRIEKEQE